MYIFFWCFLFLLSSPSTFSFNRLNAASVENYLLKYPSFISLTFVTGFLDIKKVLLSLARALLTLLKRNWQNTANLTAINSSKAFFLFFWNSSGYVNVKLWIIHDRQFMFCGKYRHRKHYLYIRHST